MGNNSDRNIFFRILPVLFFLIFLVLLKPAIGLSENLVTNIDGKIRVVILHYGDGSYFSGFWFDMSVLFRELMDKMEKDVGFVILVGTDSKVEKLKETLAPYMKQKLPDGTSRVKYLEVDVKTGRFYPWARDGYFILTDRNNDLIFLDAGFNEKPFPIVNFNDVFANARSRASTIWRGGGNIRATWEEIFMGIDTVLGINTTPRWNLYDAPETIILTELLDYQSAVNTKKMAKSVKIKKPKSGDSEKKDKQQLAEKLAALKKKFDAYANQMHYTLAPDRKVIIPGKERFFSALEKGDFKCIQKNAWHSGAQAAYHTDVYLSLGPKNSTGQRIIFIADSKKGEEIVKNMSSEERRRVEQKMPEVLVGEGFTAAGIPVSAEQIRNRFQWEKHKLLDLGLKTSALMAKTLDSTATHLGKMGYQVLRVPYFPNGLTNEGKKNDRQRGISFNYSNVLTEVYGKVKKVYMPVFGFKQLDEAAAKAYEKAGFQVIFIKGLLTNSVTSWWAGAGLDCLTSEIRIPVKWAKQQN
jgi:hypothetical protein